MPEYRTLTEQPKSKLITIEVIVAPDSELSYAGDLVTALENLRGFGAAEIVGETYLTNDYNEACNILWQRRLV